LRHTFGTLLSAAGVAPRTAQAAMRHSTIDLTMNVYTDPKLLDVAGAMDSLPALSLAATPEAVKATGTDDSTASQFAPEFAPTTGKPCTLGAIVDKVTRAAEKSSVTDADAVSVYPVKRKDPLTIAVNESWKWAALDSNQRLPPCEGKYQSVTYWYIKTSGCWSGYDCGKKWYISYPSTVPNVDSHPVIVPTTSILTRGDLLNADSFATELGISRMGTTLAKTV